LPKDGKSIELLILCLRLASKMLSSRRVKHHVDGKMGVLEDLDEFGRVTFQTGSGQLQLFHADRQGEATRKVRTSPAPRLDFLDENSFRNTKISLVQTFRVISEIPLVLTHHMQVRTRLPTRVGNRTATSTARFDRTYTNRGSSIPSPNDSLIVKSLVPARSCDIKTD
jgi:hypothetical protein